MACSKGHARVQDNLNAILVVIIIVSGNKSETVPCTSIESGLVQAMGCVRPDTDVIVLKADGHGHCEQCCKRSTEGRWSAEVRCQAEICPANTSIREFRAMQQRLTLGGF